MLTSTCSPTWIVVGLLRTTCNARSFSICWRERARSAAVRSAHAKNTERTAKVVRMRKSSIGVCGSQRLDFGCDFTAYLVGCQKRMQEFSSHGADGALSRANGQGRTLDEVLPGSMDHFCFARLSASRARAMRVLAR